MRKKISGFHLWAWALCLGVMSGPTVQAQETAGTVYIQGSEVNLRAGASTTGEVVQKVLIGTGCQRQGAVDKKGWVRVRCGDAEGFTLDKLLGPEKPNLEALLAQARDTAKSARERLDAAMRAATLEPQNEQASQLLAPLFFDVNFEQLTKDQKKGGLHESFLVLCNERSQQNRRTHEQCLTDELEKIEYDWHHLSIREGHFVSAMFREGALVVYTGYLKSRARGRFDPEDDEFDIVIESRGQSPVTDALKVSLHKGARASNPDEQKYSSFYGEYAGMPVLSLDAYRLFRTLPSIWYLLMEQSGERFILVNCGSIAGRVLQVDIYHRASIQRGDIPLWEGDPQTDRVKDISKDGLVYRLQLCNPRGCQISQTLTWPTNEPGIANWDTLYVQGLNGDDYAVSEHFSKNKGSPNKVKRYGCHESSE